MKSQKVKSEYYLTTHYSLCEANDCLLAAKVELIVDNQFHTKVGIYCLKHGTEKLEHLKGEKDGA